MLEVIPAIDLSDGKLCRLAIGGPAPVDAFRGDPLAAAEAFIATGVRWLHVVDVDLAFTGEARNVGVLRSIASLGARVQASGGMTMAREIESVLAAGAARAVLGSAALEDRAAVEDLVGRFGERLAVGLETEAGRVRPRGRHRVVDLDLVDTMSWLATVDAARFVHTNVRRVGELGGPDLEGLATVLGAGAPAISAGGIRSIADLVAVAGAGAEGAIVGRAALERKIDLAAALSALG